MIAMKTAMLLAGTLAQTDAPPPPTLIPAPNAVIAEQSPPVVAMPQAEPAPESTNLAPPLVEPIDLPIPPVAPAANASPQTDVVVTGKREAAGDPLIAVNAKAFGATQAVDTAVVGPVARAYKRSIPAPIRSGIHNFLYNLREPVVFVNFLLQFKVGKAAETAGRFIVNSTVGAAGLFDIAKRRPFRLPRRSNGFANTLGFHGVKNGAFLYLPLVGPTTVRDLFGGAIDRLLLPVAVGSPFTSASYTAPAGILGAMDHRAEFDETLKCLHDETADPYASSRAFYLQRRQAEIDRLRGRTPTAPPRCDTTGFGIGTTPPPSPPVPVQTTVPADPIAPAPAETGSGATPEALSPTPVPPNPTTPPAPVLPTPDLSDPPLTPPVAEERATNPD